MKWSIYIWNPFRSPKLGGICYCQNKVVSWRDNTVEAESKLEIIATTATYFMRQRRINISYKKKNRNISEKEKKKVWIVISVRQIQNWQMFRFLAQIFVPFLDGDR